MNNHTTPQATVRSNPFRRLPGLLGAAVIVGLTLGACSGSDASPAAFESHAWPEDDGWDSGPEPADEPAGEPMTDAWDDVDHVAAEPRDEAEETGRPGTQAYLTPAEEAALTAASEGPADSAELPVAVEAPTEYADFLGQEPRPLSGLVDIDGRPLRSTERGREVIITGTATLAAASPPTASAALSVWVQQQGGHVEAREESMRADGTGSAWLRLRIPVDRMASAVNALSEFGAVRTINVQSDDVTVAGAHLDTQIGTLTMTAEQVQQWLIEADQLWEVEHYEGELIGRHADLYALREERDTMSRQASLSTLEVTFFTEAAPAIVVEADEEHDEEEPGAVGVLDGLSDGWQATSGVFRGVMVVLGAALPPLLIGGALFVPTALYLRSRRRQRSASPTSVAAGPIPAAAPTA